MDKLVVLLLLRTPFAENTPIAFLPVIFNAAPSPTLIVPPFLYTPVLSSPETFIPPPDKLNVAALEYRPIDLAPILIVPVLLITSEYTPMLGLETFAESPTVIVPLLSTDVVENNPTEFSPFTFIVVPVFVNALFA